MTYAENGHKRGMNNMLLFLEVNFAEIRVLDNCSLVVVFLTIL